MKKNRRTSQLYSREIYPFYLSLHGSGTPLSLLFMPFLFDPFSGICTPSHNEIMHSLPAVQRVPFFGQCTIFALSFDRINFVFHRTLFNIVTNF